MSKPNFSNFQVAVWPRCAFLLLALVSLFAPCWGAESVSSVAVPGRDADTNSQDMLRGYLQVQEQIHATQLAIEHNRTQAEAAAEQNANALGARLSDIQRTLASQRVQELDAMQSSNMMLRFVAGVFAVLGFLVMLFVAYYQWRTMGRLAEITTALPVAQAQNAGSRVAARDAGTSHLLSVGSPEQSSRRLLGAVERLEKRIHELEHPAYSALPQGTSLDQAAQAPPTSSNGEVTAAAKAPEAARITVLLGKGQSLLNLDQNEEAVACFDQALSLDANHPDALVKKGAALERLRKLDEALACYDRAIAADGSLTVAYLHKGGIFNRMERFSEALECYEQALRTQETRRG
jgi:tetratricopeptide (TPR) repeat protein